MNFNTLNSKLNKTLLKKIKNLKNNKNYKANRIQKYCNCYITYYVI